jgi:putative ABC transport system ATP-binding protein
MIQTTTNTIVETQGITRAFQSGSRMVEVLHGINLNIAPGQFVALRGRSGSGKTTLLNILVGLDDPTQGQVVVLGQEMRLLNESARAKLRRESIGLLFQNAHLFPALTAQENVELVLRLQMVPTAAREQRAREALEMVGLKERARHRGMELSGGEQQRVALARALVHRPRFIIADEPTGNLDTQTGSRIIQLFQDIVRQTGIALLVATHDSKVVEAASRVLLMNDGIINETFQENS